METRPVLGMPGMRPSFLVDVSRATHSTPGQTCGVANWCSLDSCRRSKELVAMFTDEHFVSVFGSVVDEPDDYDEDEDDDEEEDDEDEEDDDEDSGEKWYLRPPGPPLVTQTPHTA